MPVIHGKEVDFNQATVEIENLFRNYSWDEIAWIVGPFSSNETLFVAKSYLGDNVFAYIPPATGKKDDILMLAEEYPNEQAIHMLGINKNIDELVNQIEKEKIRVLMIVENNIFKYLEKQNEKLSELLKTVPYKVYFTSFHDETAKISDMVIPVRTYIETEGTYINATSLLQKAEQAFEPENSDVPGMALVLSHMAYYAGKADKVYKNVEEIYDDFRRSRDELKDYSFSRIPGTGIRLELPEIADKPFKNIKVDFNIFMFKETKYYAMR